MDDEPLDALNTLCGIACSASDEPGHREDMTRLLRVVQDELEALDNEIAELKGKPHDTDA